MRKGNRKSFFNKNIYLQRLQDANNKTVLLYLLYIYISMLALNTRVVKSRHEFVSQ